MFICEIRIQNYYYFDLPKIRVGRAVQQKSKLPSPNKTKYKISIKTK